MPRSHPHAFDQLQFVRPDDIRFRTKKPWLHVSLDRIGIHRDRVLHNCLRSFGHNRRNFPSDWTVLPHVSVQHANCGSKDLLLADLVQPLQGTSRYEIWNSARFQGRQGLLSTDESVSQYLNISTTKKFFMSVYNALAFYYYFFFLLFQFF